MYHSSFFILRPPPAVERTFGRRLHNAGFRWQVRRDSFLPHWIELVSEQYPLPVHVHNPPRDASRVSNSLAKGFIAAAEAAAPR